MNSSRPQVEREASTNAENPTAGRDAVPFVGEQRRRRKRCVAREARDYIYANYTNPEGCTTAEIAAVVEVTPSHLCHRYKVVYGTTMGREIRRLRVRMARRLLETTDRLVKQVAADVGYALTSYRTFHNAFRAETAMSPGAYRRVARESRGGAIQSRQRASGGSSAA